MLSNPICKSFLLGTGLIAVLAACGGPGKPSVSLTATPTSLEDGQVITLKAEAKGGQGRLLVEFYKGTEKVGVDDTAPYETSLPITANDDVTLAFSAKAIAADGQAVVSSVVNVPVKVDKVAPTITLTTSSPKLNASGSITLMATASDNKKVVKVEFYKGASKLGEVATPTDGVYSLNVPHTADDNGTQTYSAKAYDAKGNVGSAEASVDVEIDETAPTVSLSANKTSVTTAGSVTLTANATDNKGVSKVEFFEGDNKLGEDTEAPYTLSISYTATNNGNHTYTAKAYDAKGNNSSSNFVTVAVDIDATLPTVSLASDKTSLTTAGSATLTANASDDKGVIKVEFYEGDTKLSEDTEAPYEHVLNFPFSEAGNGTHTYSAKVYDGNGNIATSDPAVNIAVDIDATAPTNLALSSTSTEVTEPSTITLSAMGSDNKGITKVEFYKGSDKIGEDTTLDDGFTHSVGLISADIGTVAFSAKAYDAAGNNASASLNVTVNAAPTISGYSNATLTVGQTYTSASPTISGGTGSKTLSINPDLPAGLSMDANGVIGGTASAASANTTYTVTVTDANNATATTTLDIAVNAALAIGGYSNAALTVGQSYTSATPTISGGTGTKTLSISPALPADLSMNSATGVISGMLSTALANATYTITVTDANSVSASTTLDIVVNAAPSISGYSSATLTAGKSYTSATPTVSGGTGTKTLSISPALPGGLNINSSTGVIGGTASTASANTSYTVTVTDANSISATTTIEIAVNAAPTISGYSNAALTVGRAYTSATPTIGGGTGTKTVSISPTLPAGLGIDSSTGIISGTASAASASTSYTVTVTDANGATATTTLSLVVNAAPTISGYSNATLTVNFAYTSATPTIGGGTGTKTVSISPTLPAGLGIDSSTGIISGTATAASASTSYTVTVTDANGATATTTVSLTVIAALPINYTSSTYSVSASAPNGTLVAAAPSITGGTGPYTFEVTNVVYTGPSSNVVFSSQFNFNTSTGAIAAKGAQKVGTYVVTIQVTDATGKKGTVTITITVS